MSTHPRVSLGIDPTEEEAILLSQITFDSKRNPEILQASCRSAGLLATSLLRRNAVPAVRRRYFSDPELNIGSKKSRKEGFESKGVSATAILRHPHFLKYLRYFIYGPDLPFSVVHAFSNQVRECGSVTSGDIEPLVSPQRCSTSGNPPTPTLTAPRSRRVFQAVSGVWH